MRGVPFEMLQCRALGHHWESATPIHRTVTSKTLLLRCTSCGSERIDDLDSYGAVTYRKYEASVGYRKVLDGPWGKESKAAYRRELMKRVRKLRREMKGAA